VNCLLVGMGGGVHVMNNTALPEEALLRLNRADRENVRELESRSVLLSREPQDLKILPH